MYLVASVGKPVLHLFHAAGQYQPAVVDEGDVVADVLHRCHVVGGVDDGVSGIAEPQDFGLQQFGVHGVETAERLVEDHQFRLVEDGDDELHLLLHALREFLLVPPGHDVEFLEPFRQAFPGVACRHALQLCQIDGLFAHLHLLVESAFFGQVSDVPHVVRRKGVSVKYDFPAVGGGDAVDDAYECGLAGTVRTEEAEDAPASDADADLVERGMLVEAFADLVSGENVFHVFFLDKKGCEFAKLRKF